MEDAQRIEEIRAAYEAAHFEERTPDEAGFAAIFESEIKPGLIQGIERALIAAERRRRKLRVTILILALFGLAAFTALFSLLSIQRRGTISERFLQAFIGILSFGAIPAILFNRLMRTGETDPINALAIDAVLKKFDCRIGKGVAPHHPKIDEEPVFPPHTRMDVQSDYLLGKFDGHIDFAAVRVKTSRSEGKSMTVTFKGWYLRIDLPFTFQGTTVIRERAVFPPMETAPDISGLRSVSLEDPVFDRRFDVVSTDQVEARVILAPDVIQHLAEAKTDRQAAGGLTLAFDSGHAYLWLPSRATALSDWRPLDPPRLIEDLHETFTELASMRALLRDIDVIAESEGFRAQAARNAVTQTP